MEPLLRTSDAAHRPMSDATLLRSVPAPTCPICGGGGALQAEGLKDELFGAPGTWALRRCERPTCGTLWLDPSPHPEDLGLAYRSYYTHVPPPDDSWMRRAYWCAARAHLASHWGYADAAPPAWSAWMGVLFVLAPARRRELEHSILYLRGERRGRLLDVGCGEGARIERLGSLGWRCEGVDPDPVAVARAQERGLAVRAGELDELATPAGAYDAITVAHVIEHVPDPVALLRFARRALVAGGRLVVVTPNAESLGSVRFGARWRGLEPPRHLQVFTPRALESAARVAGFGAVAVRTVTRLADIIARESLEPGRAASRGPWSGDVRAAARRFAREEESRYAAEPGCGEEIVLEARA